MQKLFDIIESGEYAIYGVRAHRSEAVVGESLGRSRVWIDGVCTDDELPGTSTIRVNSPADLGPAVDLLKATYCWDGETIVLVGGHSGQWGEDDGEFIIRDNVCLGVIDVQPASRPRNRL